MADNSAITRRSGKLRSFVRDPFYLSGFLLLVAMIPFWIVSATAYLFIPNVEHPPMVGIDRSCAIVGYLSLSPISAATLEFEFETEHKTQDWALDENDRSSLYPNLYTDNQDPDIGYTVLILPFWFISLILFIIGYFRRRMRIREIPSI